MRAVPKSPNTVVPINRRQEDLHRELLADLEGAAKSLRVKQVRLDSMGNAVMDMVEGAIKDQKITAYRAALAFGRLVDSVTRLEQVRLGLYDRLAGTVGMYGPTEETEDERPDYEIQRMSEKLCFELVKSRVERNRAEAAQAASQLGS